MRRCYKPALPQAVARQILRDAAGTQLDAKLVDIFLAIPKEELLTCVPAGVEVGGAAADAQRAGQNTSCPPFTEKMVLFRNADESGRRIKILLPMKK